MKENVLLCINISSRRFGSRDSVVGITGWTVRGSMHGRGEIFRTLPDRPWGPPSLLYDRYLVSFLGLNRPGRGVAHALQHSAEVKERVELYLFSHNGPSWSVPG